MTNEPDGVNAVGDANSYGLAALGKTGVFTVELLNGSAGELLLSVESPAWDFCFELASRATPGALSVFLGSQLGRTEFAELPLGSFGGVSVRLVKDDEFEDRFFLRASGGGSSVEFTLVGAGVRDFTSAVRQAAEEFDAEA